MQFWGNILLAKDDIVDGKELAIYPWLVNLFFLIRNSYFNEFQIDDRTFSSQKYHERAECKDGLLGAEGKRALVQGRVGLFKTTSRQR